MSPNNPRIAVFGAAHLDILATPDIGACGVDRQGNITIAAGGTAHNLAVHLAGLGARVCLITAMRESPFSDLVLEGLAQQGVEVDALIDPKLPIAAFCAHLTPQGGLDRAVTAAAVEQAFFSRGRIRAALCGADSAMAECNLSALALARVSQECARRAVPLYISGVSEAKARRALAARQRAALFLREREFLRISHDYRERLEELLSSPIVVVNDDQRVTVRDGGNLRSIETHHLAADTVLHGFSDILAATSVFFATSGHRLYEAVSLALESLHAAASRGRACRTPSDIEETLLALSRDALTGLLNRRGFAARLDRMGEGALVVLDIDHFKRVNDLFGHEEGDRVISWVASELKKGLRDGDALARWGGEEFLLAAPGISATQAAHLAERLRSAVESDSRKGRLPCPVTLSAGVAGLKPGAFEVAFRAADAALYRAKREGRNRVVAAEA